jgi:predicted TPR repeat methyltransferase
MLNIQPASEPLPSGTYSDVRAHFEKKADGYETGCDKVRWIGPEKLHEALAAHIDAKIRALRVLDLGAGTGRLGKLFKDTNPDTYVTAVDLSEKMLAIAHATGRADRTLAGDVTKLPHDLNGQFDIVTSAGVLDFIENTEAFADQTARALRTGGHWAITFEPEGTNFPGVKTLRHNSSALIEQFADRGLRTIHADSFRAYTNFKTGADVENIMLIGTLDR